MHLSVGVFYSLKDIYTLLAISLMLVLSITALMQDNLQDEHFHFALQRQVE